MHIGTFFSWPQQPLLHFSSSPSFLRSLLFNTLAYPILLQYKPPARPNGVPMHDVEISTVQASMGAVNINSYALTFIPAVCEASLPLLNVSLAGDSVASGASLALIPQAIQSNQLCVCVLCVGVYL